MSAGRRERDLAREHDLRPTVGQRTPASGAAPIATPEVSKSARLSVARDRRGVDAVAAVREAAPAVDAEDAAPTPTDAVQDVAALHERISSSMIQVVPRSTYRVHRFASMYASAASCVFQTLSTS